MSAPDKYYSRNASCTLNLISTLLYIIRRDVVHTKFDFYIIVYYSSGRSESCDLYNIGSIKEMRGLNYHDEWDSVVALPRHKFVTGATLLQLGKITPV